MSSAKVFIFAPADAAGETHKRLESHGCEVSLGKASWQTPMGNEESEIVEMARGADALAGTSIRSTPITREIMQASDKLRIVAKYTIGCDDVDTDAATEMGIMVTHSPTESNWGGVAEGTVANMLCLTKKLRERDAHLKSGAPWRDEHLMGSYLGSRASDGWQGVTLGIVGLGRVGGRVATLLRTWQIRIIACDPYIPDSRFEELGVQKVDLDRLLRESDVITLHTFLSRETRHLIDEAAFAKMKPGVVFLNASRGQVVDEPALIRALESGQVGCAGLDVFEREPLPLDSPLRKMGDKVLLSPHMISSNVGSGLGPGVVWATESILHALRGEMPDNVFNKEVIPAWQERFGGRSLI